MISWDLTALLTIQKQLDDYIHNHHNTNYQLTVHQRVLALVVELNELANATKCFKYWSHKVADPQEVLVEYVDCLHFVLSLVLFYNLPLKIIQLPSSFGADRLTLTKIFWQLNRDCYQINDPTLFPQWIRNFLALASALKLTQDLVVDAYHLKNQLNFARQKNDY